jgi:hypothetical protein
MHCELIYRVYQQSNSKIYTIYNCEFVGADRICKLSVTILVVLEIEYLHKKKINVDLLKSEQKIKLIFVVVFALKQILGPT